MGVQGFEGEVSRIAEKLTQESQPFHVLGYSMGSRVALGLALRYPSVVGRLTLVGVNPGLTNESDRRARARWEAEWIELLRQSSIEEFERKWSALPLFQTQSQLTTPEARAKQRQIRRSHCPAGLAVALETLGLASMPNLWPELVHIEVPTLLVVGEHDPKFRAIADAMVEQVPRAQLAVLEGAGHNPLLEAPERLRALLETVTRP